MSIDIDQTTVAEAAYLARKFGISVVPPTENGEKAPGPDDPSKAGSWNTFQERQPTRREMANWYGDRQGWGAVCGAVSGNLEALDFDDTEAYDQYRERAREFGVHDLVDMVAEGCSTRTPSGGVHFLWRCDTIGGSTKLAMRPAPTEGNPHHQKTLIELKGEGGYVIEAPSGGDVHPSGRPYVQLAGGPDTIANITSDERDALLSLARSFDERPAPTEEKPRPKRPKADDGTTSPGDDYEARMKWSEVLPNWTLVFQRGDTSYWRRPGKERGVSATTNHNGTGTLKVFSTSAGLPTEGTLSKFGVYAHLNHGGDFTAAAKALCEQGYGTYVEEVVDGLHLHRAVRQNPRPKPRPKQATRKPAAALSPEMEPQPGHNGNGRGPVEPEAAEPGRKRPKVLCNFAGSSDSRRYLSTAEILTNITTVTGGWPKRTRDGLLFVPDRSGGSVRPGFLDRPSKLFAYLGRHAQVIWGKGEAAVTREVCYEMARMDAEAYEAIQAHPHWPALDGMYYLHDEIPEGGATGALDEYLDFFKFASPTDRELGRAYIVTPYWGGPPGSRPAFVMTTEDDVAGNGVGYGKSTFAYAPALGSPGFTVSINRSSDIDTVKARLLSDQGMRARVVMLDNVKSLRLSSEDLEALVTEKVISGKRMYHGEAANPNCYTFSITANDAALSRDLSSRSTPIRLGRAEYDGRWSREVERFLKTKRLDVLRDIRAMLTADAPATYSSRSRWATWELEVLAKCDTPEAARDRFMEGQGALDEDAKQAEAVRDRFMFEIGSLLPGTPDAPTADTIQAEIPPPIAADWLNRALRKHYADNAACRHLKSLKIRELQHDRTTAKRQWIWTGERFHEAGKQTVIRVMKSPAGVISYTSTDF